MDVAPGLGLTTGATVFADGLGRSRPLERSVLRIAWSPLDGAALDFATPAFAMGRRTAVTVRATMASARRFAAPDGAPATAGTAVQLTGRRYTIEPTVTFATSLEPVRLSAGPVFEYTALQSALVPAAARIGAQAQLEAAWVSSGGTRGFSAALGGVWYAPAMGLARPAVVGRADVRALLTLPVPTAPALLVRGGLQHAWGPTDVHTAAVLGGDATFRGAPTARYAGTVASHAGAELRVPVTRIAFLGATAVGVLGFMDAGRVWTRGEAGTGWLTAAGGGLWIRPGSSHRTFSAGIARGPEGARLYVRTDIGF